MRPPYFHPPRNQITLSIEISTTKDTANLHFLNFIHPYWFKKFIEQTTIDPAYLRFHTEPEVKKLLSFVGFQVEIQYSKDKGNIYAICTK